MCWVCYHGHVLIPTPANEKFKGVCPFHGKCLEGLASGPAIEARWGKKGSELEPDHPAWVLEAEYLASALVNYIVVLSPQRIIIGGGVSHQEQLFPIIHQKVQEKLNGYVDRKEILTGIEDFIVPPGLGNQAGILGCLVLASQLTE